MINLAVLTYQHVVDNSLNIPIVWPAEVRELGESITLPGPNWVLMTLVELESYKTIHQATYDAWEDSYFAPTIAQIAAKAIGSAREFGTKLMDRFAVENVTMGITQAGKTIPVALYCHRLEHYISTGSLYAALSEIAVMMADNTQAKTDLAPFITNERLTGYQIAIQAYLGL